MDKIDWAARSAFVTGGNGFIGRHLVRRLLSRGSKVRVLDVANGQAWAHNHKLEIVQDTILNPSAVDYAANGCDICYHLAGIRFSEDQLTYHDINATGTIRVLDGCLRQKVKRFVNVSEVAGRTETTSLLPRDAYHVSKAVAELYTSLYNRAHGLETVCLRLSEIFGPEQPLFRYIIPNLIHLMRANQDAVLYAAPRYSRDFCYVENVVDAMLLTGEVDVAGQIINIGSGESHGLKTLASTAKNILKEAFIPRIIIKEIECPWVYTGNVCIEKATKGLGYRPKVSFEAGLRKYIGSLK